MEKLWLDLETFASINLKSVGAHRYAEEAEIMLAQWAWDDGPITVWEMDEDRAARTRQLQSMINVADEVISHGAFDPIMLEANGLTVPLEKRVDTMVLALEHGMPGGLDKLCDILGVPVDKAKMKDAGALIALFCSPCPSNWKIRRATKLTHPEKWATFLEYAGLDIEAMREIFKRIPRWNWTPLEREYWHLDQETNKRGIAIDLHHANSALDAFARLQKRLAARTTILTNGKVGSTTQREALLAHIQDDLGIRLGDLTAETVEKFLARDALNPGLRELLENRQQAAATSPAKYRALIKSSCRDGRLRGALQFSGASRTRRDAGRIFQPQNLPRATLSHEDIETGIRAMKVQCEELLFDVSELCISAVRGAIVAEPGNVLHVSDLSNIEGRILAWLAEEQWKIEAFRAYDRGDGPDIYKVTAGEILKKAVADVTKLDRQMMGKVPELACGYQGSVGAFRQMGGKAVEAMTDDQIKVIVDAWRARHPKTKAFWYAMENAAVAAIRNPDKSYPCGLITFDMKDGPDGTPYLRMKLPSGGYLSYMNPQGGAKKCPACDGAGSTRATPTSRYETCVDCDGAGSFGVDGITYEGQDPYTKQWKRLSTYGGKLTENAVQAIARDVFFYGMRNAAREGYPIVLRVHDELVAEVPEGSPLTLDRLAACMSVRPPWAVGLPLAAAGFTTTRYRKD